MERHKYLDSYALVCTVTSSDYCNVDLNTALYDWSYDQFLPIKIYYDLQEDRNYWEEKRVREEERRNNSQ